jgi:hypothetical protein
MDGRSGVLPLAGEENWFKVTFVGDVNNNAYHPHITITSGSDDIRFDVQSGASCSSGLLSCPAEGNGAAANLKNWEVKASPGGNITGVACGAGCGPNKCICNGCVCTSTGFSPLPFVGTVYIKVHRVTGSPTCNTYTLSVSG